MSPLLATSRQSLVLVQLAVGSAGLMASANPRPCMAVAVGLDHTTSLPFLFFSFWFLL